MHVEMEMEKQKPSPQTAMYTSTHSSYCYEKFLMILRDRDMPKVID